MARLTHAQRIIALLRETPDLDDDEIAIRLGTRRQVINQECRRLADQGALKRGSGGLRGKIVNTLNADGPPPQPSLQTSLSGATSSSQYSPLKQSAGEKGEVLAIAELSFERVCEITPKRTPEGALQGFMPQERYRNTSGVGLNRYGVGPFCKFTIPSKPAHAGVYVISVDRIPMYVGESSRDNLAEKRLSKSLLIAEITMH